MKKKVKGETCYFASIRKYQENKEVIQGVAQYSKITETGKSYIAYTDNTKDENGNIKVYANIYDPNGESLKLEPITTDKEWKAINNILISVQEKVREVVEENGDTDK